MGRHSRDVCAREGRRGRHRALRCRGVAFRARRRLRALPDLRQRTLALRVATGGYRARLPCHVRRPHAGSEDAAVTSKRPQSTAASGTPHTYGASMNSKLRLLAPLGLAGLIGLISAGCGSNASPESGTSSAGNTSSTGTTSAGTTSSGADKKLTAQEKAVKFAECMRANGVPHFPDPDPNGDSNFGVDVTIREHGVKDFPDPVNSEPVIDTYKIPSSNKP